ncbi:MerR family transcriptional regulator [Saccharothrix yanglingensis]|uniref:MerR family transcriptional regulator n=1 Tax=Saccharothrix yanglingensis TaxID=659496 RepID=A0ABU0X4Y2_9PSEU|nr:MerR family transcriptional regulator [Saccharothrix yanglingensis]MDQ2586773.1 MerR family transcriptional regulator [Saccharothrix yanglingensis]
MDGKTQIGEVAERTGPSPRTIRYYEELGPVVPDTRGQGGFRLRTEPDVDRLQPARRMKRGGSSWEEVRELLTVVDGLSTPDAPERDGDLGRLARFRAAAEERCEGLRARLRVAEDFAITLRAHLPADRAS